MCLAFNPQSTVLITGSMDHTAKLWDIVSGTEIASLHVWYFDTNLRGFMRISYSIQGHTGEIISVSFNTRGDQVITASFDRTVAIWDVRTGK